MFIELKDAQGNKEIVNLLRVNRIFALPKKKGYSRLFFEDSMDKFTFKITEGKLEKNPHELTSKGPKAYYGYKDYQIDYVKLLSFLEQKNVLLGKLKK